LFSWKTFSAAITPSLITVPQILTDIVNLNSRGNITVRHLGVSLGSLAITTEALKRAKRTVNASIMLLRRMGRAKFMGGYYDSLIRVGASAKHT
jgi:hypothetical protein